jgi:hypothetical protein
LGRSTSSAPGASVVDVVLDDVVAGVVDVVEVGAAVVTGMVVVVEAGTVVLVVTIGASDDVEPLPVVAGLSLLQAENASAMRATGTRRVDFTWEVCHAEYRLPDQGVGFVATFNKL